MTKIQMLEPYWYEVISEDGLKVEMHKTDEAAVDAALDMGGVVEINHLITTDQAEAYADARVKQALEEAIDAIQRAWHESQYVFPLPKQTDEIRALIHTK